MNTGSKSIYIKVLVLCLLFSLTLSSTSCYSIESTVNKQTVSADTPWYDAEVIDFKLETDTNKHLNRLFYSIAGADDKYIAIISDGGYHVKAWTDDIEYKDWLIYVVTMIDRTTKQTVKTIDIVNILGKCAYPTNVNYIDGRTVRFGTMKMKLILKN